MYKTFSVIEIKKSVPDEIIFKKQKITCSILYDKARLIFKFNSEKIV